MYLYQHKPDRPWLALVIYPRRGVEKAVSKEFKSFMNLPELQRIYLEDYRNQSQSSPTLKLIRLIASHKRQTIPLAQELAKQPDIMGAYGLDFIETILVYKLPNLSCEDIKKMLALNDVQLKDTRFYQEIAEQEGQKGLQKGRKEECIVLLSRQLRRKFTHHPELDKTLQHLPELPLARLEDLADALLDFSTLKDFQIWLQTH